MILKHVETAIVERLGKTFVRLEIHERDRELASVLLDGPELAALLGELQGAYWEAWG